MCRNNSSGVFSVETFVVLLIPRWCRDKESSCNAGDTRDAVPSLGREDPLEKELTTHAGAPATDRGAWRATVRGVAKELDVLD